ncbi:MAG: hypothetical protein Q7J61_00845, partial [Deltaproteobacteria bacterium]|nr:hypothetical protein [Deltaproteobacteria bacterium]
IAAGMTEWRLLQEAHLNLNFHDLHFWAISDRQSENGIQESEAVKRETKDVRHLTSRIERLRLTADYGLLTDDC